jgi:carbon storage regulator
MLVLTRKLNQEIVIGDNIRITVVAVGNDQVKLGITAPRSIPVHRSEIYRERQSLVLAGAGTSKPTTD